MAYVVKTCLLGIKQAPSCDACPFPLLSGCFQGFYEKFFAYVFFFGSSKGLVFFSTAALLMCLLNHGIL